MIEVSRLSKDYGGHRAVEELSFTLVDGGVYGLLGPNGAGKSTTMNMMTGCLSPTAGTVKIGGWDILEDPRKAKKQMGYLPEQPPLYMNETVEEYLNFVGEAKGLSRGERAEQVEKAIFATGLEPVRGRLIGALSKGYKQRVGIAQALLGEPEVIILDEPTVGLDPLQILEIRDLIRHLGENHTVILSSHILSEVQAVCRKVLILRKGKLVAFDTTENLEKRLHSAQRVSFRVKTGRETAEEMLGAIEGLGDWEIREDGETLWVSAAFAQGAEAEEVCGKISLGFAGRGVPVIELRREKADLEEVFLELTDGSEESEAAPENEPEGAAEETEIRSEEGSEDESNL